MALKKVLTIAGSDTSAGARYAGRFKNISRIKYDGMVVYCYRLLWIKIHGHTMSHHYLWNVFEKQLETALSIAPYTI